MVRGAETFWGLSNLNAFIYSNGGGTGGHSRATRPLTPIRFMYIAHMVSVKESTIRISTAMYLDGYLDRRDQITIIKSEYRYIYIYIYI